MIELDEKLYTPKDLAECGLMSKTKQWQERESGRLKCFRVGKKIFYSKSHLQDYFSLSEKQAEETLQSI